MKLLSKTRYLGRATLDSAPVTIAAATAVGCTATLAVLISNLPNNSLVTVGILSAQLITDAGGADFLTIQNAYLNLNGGAMVQPANASAPLALANGASFSAQASFHDTDLATTSAISAQLAVLVSNPDTSGHDVNSLAVTFEVNIATFDEPIYAENLVGLGALQ